MSTRRIVPHIEAGYLEDIVDGQEDWLTFFEGIESVMVSAEVFGIRHLLMDFSAGDLRIAVSEAPDIVRLIDGLSPWALDIGVVSNVSARSHKTLAAIVSGFAPFAHNATILTDDAAKADWIIGVRSLPRAS
jgi:hypothetical protein